MAPASSAVGRTPPDLPPWPVPEVEPIDSDLALARLAQSLRSADAIGIHVAVEPSARRMLEDPRRLLATHLVVAVEVERKPHVAAIELSRLGDLSRLSEILRGDRAPYVIFHDAQRDLFLATALGLTPARVGSTLIAAMLLAEGSQSVEHLDLPSCVARVLGARLESPPPLLRGHQDLGPEGAAATTLIPLMRRLAPMLRRRTLAPIYELECHLVPAVVAMERAGIRVDAPRFQRIADGWVHERRNCADPDRAARLDKLISTYGHWARDFVDLDGRIRCRLHPLAADSGRFSCTQPNLQQVPAEHTAPGLRACFVADPGHRLIIADYAQIELRVAAHLAPCEALRRVFRDGRDPHRATAAAITGKREEAVSDHERKLAKAVNFGFLFGMGASRFREYARDGYGVELDEREALRAREAFFTTFPGIAAWHRRTRDLSRRTEEGVVVRTAMGRRKRFAPGRFSFNAALNIPVQGTAAEGFKLAMIELHERLPALGARSILCVHDEYLVEVPQQNAEKARTLVEEIMIAAMQRVVASVPIAVDAAVADSWR